MPNDEPQQTRATEEERAQIRRTRAARIHIRRLGLGSSFDVPLVERLARELEAGEVDDAIAWREAELEEERERATSQRQIEAKRHEGRGC